MERVTIRWSGPYRLDHLEIHDSAWEYGVYAIYETNDLGAAHLIYIGKTTRSVASRIREHHREWLQRIKGHITVGIGLIEPSPGQRFSAKRLNDVEAALIQYHQPRENTKNMVSYNGRPHLSITNTGRRGQIVAWVSTVEHFEDW